jgi:Tfp pilus assembly protein PilO
MNKLSKEKKDKLLLTGLAALGTIAVLYFLVITDQKAEIDSLKNKISALSSKRDMSSRLGKKGGDIQANFEAQKKILEQKQAEMPRPEEDHIWFIRIMEDMRSKYGLELDDIVPPQPVEAGVLPKFPFRAISLSVSMVGSYTDFGRFLADFENRYPYMRVQNLTIAEERLAVVTRPGESLAAATAAARETGKLRFNYRVIALIKSPI